MKPPPGKGRRRAAAAPQQVVSFSPDPVVVDCAAYVSGVRQDLPADPISALTAIRDAGEGFVWVGLHEPTAEDMAVIGEAFGLHELAMEDAVVAHQRPKMERYRDHLFLVLKTVAYVDEEVDGDAGQIVNTGELMIFLGHDFIVTVRHGQHSGLADLRHRLEDKPEHLALGPAVVMHQIADTVVDRYLDVVDLVENDVDEMEAAVFTPESGVGIEQIHRLKREILELRRSVTPLNIPLSRLAESNPSQHTFVPTTVRAYFRDVEDHLVQVADRITSYDEILTTLINATLAEIATRQNNDMRKISAWAAIALVPTAIAGIYGMNFEDMPELGWTFGYPLALALMAVICLLLFRSLRRRGWL